MEVRNRSINSLSVTGEVFTFNSGVRESLGFSSVADVTRTSMDWWKKKVREDNTLPPTPCTITKTILDPATISGQSGVFHFSNYAVTLQPNVPAASLNTVRPPKVSGARNTENADLVQRLLAETNPFRTEFSAPVALKELVDVGTLFKISAASFASLLGSSYLNYKFGWKQFVDDVKTLSNITLSIERRIKEIQSLSKHGGTRRKRNLMTKGSESSFVAGLINSTWSARVRVNARTRCTCETFGTVRWRFRPGFDNQLSKLEEFNLAVAKVFDSGQLDAQTVWNMIPFSWLVDYFTGLDSYFGSWLGEGIIEPYDICIVRRTEGRQYYSSPQYNNPTFSMNGSPKVAVYEYDRDVLTRGSFPAVRADFLSRNQLLTIAALAASFKR